MRTQTQKGGGWRGEMERGGRKARKAKGIVRKGGGREEERKERGSVWYDEGNKRTARKANKRLGGRVRPMSLFADI